jgi:hypothetical protein
VPGEIACIFASSGEFGREIPFMSTKCEGFQKIFGDLRQCFSFAEIRRKIQ